MADAEAGGNGVNPPYRILIPLVAVAIHAPLVIGLSLRGRSSYHPVRRFVLSFISAMYFPLMSYVLSSLPAYLSSMLKPSSKLPHAIEELPILKWCLIASILLSLILIQYLKAKADMAALAVSAVTSPVARDDIDRLKIRPSIESTIYSFWVAGVVIYSLILHYSKAPSGFDDDRDILVYIITPLIAPLWVLGACRVVLSFAIFQMATRSFAVGRNSQLIEGHMFQVVEEAGKLKAEAPPPPPRLIVTGERKEDLEETPLGYQIKSSALEDKKGSLITLDRVWSCDQLEPKHKDLCLSLALFKCLRRRFAGRRLAEAGSDWAFKFVSDGLLDAQGDPVRIFQVIADELSFVSGFYYAPLPVASLGTFSAALHFFLSFLISALFCFLTLLLLVAAVFIFLTTLSAVAATSVLAFVLAAVNAVTEISDMVASVRSNWTKISIIGHIIRCRPSCRVRTIFFWLLGRRGPSKIWKDKMGQVELLKPILSREQPRRARFFLRIRRKHRHNMTVKDVPLEVKKAILASLRELGKKRDGTDTVRLRCHAFFYPGGGREVSTTTEVILVWHIAMELFKLRYSASSSTPPADRTVARSLSRYCAYLVVEAPDLLPDNSAWVKRLYKEVKEGIEAASKSIDAVQETGVLLYERLIACFSAQSSHKVLKIASKLVEEDEKLRVDTRAGGEDAVWKFLAEFWSEMLLHLAPSDDVKHHIEALQRGGELISLLRALLLHAGIISRPSLKQFPEP